MDAARDRFGIKPLYTLRDKEFAAIASEPVALMTLRPRPVDPLSVQELRLVRRPLPGRSFFLGVEEILPGHSLSSDGILRRFARLPRAADAAFDQAELNELVRVSVSAHEMGDVPVVSLLSGGLDSAIVTGLSTVHKTYCVGLAGNNEFDGAAETAAQLGKSVERVQLAAEDLPRVWRELSVLRGEPLAVPNEALIYRVCKAMATDEKVLLTGEGADELFFGYDNIYRWSPTSGGALRSSCAATGTATRSRPPIASWATSRGCAAGRASSSSSKTSSSASISRACSGGWTSRRWRPQRRRASRSSRPACLATCTAGPPSCGLTPRNRRYRFAGSQPRWNLRGALARRKVGFSATPAAMRTRSAEYEPSSHSLPGGPRMVIGYTTGVFDLFHIGHVNVLRNAKSMCDRLVVGVTVDALVSYKSKRAVIPFEERIEIVRSCKYVDLAVPQQTMDKLDALNRYKFNMIFVGDDWYLSDKWQDIDRDFQERGVRVIYFPYTKTTSSTVINQTLERLRSEPSPDALAIDIVPPAVSRLAQT